uniref:Uncharacterized protein n=1 Tax=Oryza brachyantha TaxID=4533 RepID=J3L4Z3_ORYBR
MDDGFRRLLKLTSEPRSLTNGSSPPEPGRTTTAPCSARPPSYRVSLDKAFTPSIGERHVNVLTSDESFVLRLYYIEASEKRGKCGAWGVR